jgi:hypothetical protein
MMSFTADCQISPIALASRSKSEGIDFEVKREDRRGYLDTNTKVCEGADAWEGGKGVEFEGVEREVHNGEAHLI